MQAWFSWWHPQLLHNLSYPPGSAVCWHHCTLVQDWFLAILQSLSSSYCQSQKCSQRHLMSTASFWICWTRNWSLPTLRYVVRISSLLRWWNGMESQKWSRRHLMSTAFFWIWRTRNWSPPTHSLSRRPRCSSLCFPAGRWRWNTRTAYSSRCQPDHCMPASDALAGASYHTSQFLFFDAANKNIRINIYILCVDIG